MIPQSITFGSILEFFKLQHGHDSSPAELSLAKPAGTPWVLGFFSGRGKPLALLGGTGARPLKKRERGLPGTPDGACGQPERELLARPWVDYPLWGVPLFLGQKLSRGPTVPRTGDSSARGEPESPPSTGLGHWGKTPQRGDHLWKERAKNKKKKSKKKN